MRKITILFAIFILFGFKHPFYLSVTDLKYNHQEQALQGTVKIFVNDLEEALKKINKKSVDLINVKDQAATTGILKSYLSTHLLLAVNNISLNCNVIGFEKEEEAIWIYVEFNNCKSPKKITVTNTLLYDFIAEQSNIVQLEVNGNSKSQKVSKPDKTMNFDF